MEANVPWNPSNVQENPGRIVAISTPLKESGHPITAQAATNNGFPSVASYYSLAALLFYPGEARRQSCFHYIIPLIVVENPTSAVPEFYGIKHLGDQGETQLSYGRNPNADTCNDKWLDWRRWYVFDNKGNMDVIVLSAGQNPSIAQSFQFTEKGEKIISNVIIDL